MKTLIVTGYVNTCVLDLTVKYSKRKKVVQLCTKLCRIPSNLSFYKKITRMIFFSWKHEVAGNKAIALTRIYVWSG